MPQKIIFTDEQVQKIITMFNEKLNMTKIGKVFGVTGPVITRVLLENGLTPKQRRYDVNEEYFDNVDTEEKAYWLGFLAADGCVRRRVNNDTGKTRGDSIVLKLSVMDEDHIVRFKNQISPNSKISYYTSKTITKKGNLSISNACTVRINSNKLVQSIIKLGVTPKKTFTIDKPNIEEKYYKHFIRGFFDGDGCAHLAYRTNNNPRLYFSIACASDKLKSFFIEELNKLGIEFYQDNLSIFIKKHISNYLFYHYLYDEATVFLKRKKDKADIFINFFNNMNNRTDSFPGKHAYDLNYKKIDREWTDEEIKILYETNNKIPFSFLSGTLLPNKSVPQIARKRKKLGINCDNRKIVGYLKIRKELKGH